MMLHTTPPRLQAKNCTDELGYNITDVDSIVPPAEARAQIADQVILSNVSTVPVLRNGSAAEMAAKRSRLRGGSIGAPL
jgi:hypothetical protein